MLGLEVKVVAKNKAGLVLALGNIVKELELGTSNCLGMIPDPDGEGYVDFDFHVLEGDVEYSEASLAVPFKKGLEVASFNFKEP